MSKAVSDIEWTKENTLHLIQEYKIRPGLWDMTCTDYRKKTVKRELLDEVYKRMGCKYSLRDIEKKFHTLRTQYHRELSRIKNDDSKIFRSKWFAFKPLHFLSSPKACRGAAKREIYYIEPSQFEIISGDKVLVKKFCVTPGAEHSDQSNVITWDELGEPNTDIKPKSNPTEKVTESSAQTDFKNDLVNSSVNFIISDFTDNEFGQKLQKASKKLNTEVTTVEYEQHDDQMMDTQENGGEQCTIDTTINESKLINGKRDDESVYDESSLITIKRPSLDKSMNPDEYTIYGDYIANELRFITSREILINLKHKINTAIFEASMAQLQKIS